MNAAAPLVPAFPAPRRKTRSVLLGTLRIGGGAPVSVQTMATADTRDAEAAAAQASECFDSGADVVRFAVPDSDAAIALGRIKRLLGPGRPIVADIHFDHRLALAALAAGADGLRINPGNIGSAAKVREVAAAARDCGAPIRVGVNAGSIAPDVLAKYCGATAEALVESALSEVGVLENAGFDDVVVSVKASDVPRCVAAYRLLALRTDRPVHVGLTEAGTLRRGTAASAAALGVLLGEGIGDTIRVSLTAPPREEVRVGLELLRALGLRDGGGASVTSCPTCGRTRCDVFGTASAVEDALEALYRADPDLPRPRVAVMGCVVNGPGEARDADVALVGGDNCFFLYERGVRKAKLAETEAVAALLRSVRAFGANGSGRSKGEAKTETGK